LGGGLSLQNLGALTWLLPLAGIIILLYLLRMRRRDLRVPATFLWPERTDEVRANSLFQKLRFSWLLVLQLLALSLVVFALARPQTKQRGLAGEVTILVVDASASMGAADIKPSRFEEARRLAEEAIQSAKAGDRIALIEAGPVPRVVFPLSSDPPKQLRALESRRRVDSEADIGEAMRLGAALVGSQESARIVLLSDGVFDPITDFSPGKASIVYKKIGSSAENLAVSALGTTDTPQGRQLFVGVRNFGHNAMKGTITLSADGKAIDSEKIEVASGKTWGKTIQAPPGAKVFEADLDAPDALKADNYAVNLADAGAVLRVLLVSIGDYFLERALTLDPRVTLDRSTSVPTDQQPGTTGPGRYDIVIFDGIAETPVKARGVLALGQAGGGSPVTVAGETKNPSLISATDNPMMEGVDLQGVFIDRAQNVKPVGQGEVLATGSGGPLVVASRGDQKHVYLAFQPLHSDFPLSVSFPIFIANVLDFLGGEANATAMAVRAGSPFAVSAKSPVILRPPDGGAQTVALTGNQAILRDVRSVGRYEIEVDGKRKAVYASLRSDRESQIDPRNDLSIAGGEVRAVQSPVHFADFWKPLALLALLVLSFEWWLYARRS
jgi:Ca-activated chloride channel homolog